MIAFGRFQLFAAERRLLKDATPVDIGSRALDILIALVERAGETVSKRDIVARVWPDVVVEESSLRVHVAALRKALAETFADPEFLAEGDKIGLSLNEPRSGEELLRVIERAYAMPPDIVDRLRKLNRDQ